jgi:hypothetical protein
MADPLDQLQNPEEQQADNVHLINQFNHANPDSRNEANAFASGAHQEFDDRIKKLHGIEGRIILGEMAPIEQFDPDVMKKVQWAQSVGQMPVAYNLMSDENHKVLARNQMGGTMSPDEWTTLRDYYGRKNAATIGSSSSTNTGPISFPNGAARQQELAMAIASPDSKQAAYEDGIRAFDNLFGKFKPYLVAEPKQATMPHTVEEGKPAFKPHEDAIVKLMRKAAIIGQQQQAGGPTLSPDEFNKMIGR